MSNLSRHLYYTLVVSLTTVIKQDMYLTCTRVQLLVSTSDQYPADTESVGWISVRCQTEQFALKNLWTNFHNLGRRRIDIRPPQ